MCSLYRIFSESYLLTMRNLYFIGNLISYKQTNKQWPVLIKQEPIFMYEKENRHDETNSTYFDLCSPAVFPSQSSFKTKQTSEPMIYKSSHSCIWLLYNPVQTLDIFSHFKIPHQLQVCNRCIPCISPVLKKHPNGWLWCFVIFKCTTYMVW